jgi:hypothetical protein
MPDCQVAMAFVGFVVWRWAYIDQLQLLVACGFVIIASNSLAKGIFAYKLRLSQGWTPRRATGAFFAAAASVAIARLVVLASAMVINISRRDELTLAQRGCHNFTSTEALKVFGYQQLSKWDWVRAARCLRPLPDAHCLLPTFRLIAATPDPGPNPAPP